jgi:hypothetical protein
MVRSVRGSKIFLKIRQKGTCKLDLAVYVPNIISKYLIFQELFVDFPENVQHSASLHLLVISD